MASPQTENGYTRLADELLESLIRFPFTKRQYKVLLAVIRKTYGYGKREDDLTSTQLADLTGLTAAHCRGTVLELEHLNVLKARRGRFGKVIGLVKDYEQWGVPKRDVLKQDGHCSNMERSDVPKQDYTASHIGTHNRHSPKNNSKTQPLQQESDRDFVPLLSGSHPQDTGGGCGVIFPGGLSDNEVECARKMLAVVLESHRQEILDVLAASIAAGEIRKSPLACLGGLIRRFQAGSFDPSTGLHIAEKREVVARSVSSQREKSTQEVLREHARLSGVPEDEYLRRIGRNG